MNNVINFPKDNKRLDVSTTPITAEDVAKEIEKIKMDFYHEVADELQDSLMRKLGTLNIADDPDDVVIEEKDIIFIREVLTAFICKIGGIDHPLKNIAEAVVTDLKIFDDGRIDYKLKTLEILSESDSKST